MAGYTRQSLADIQDGEDIVAGPLNDEFDQLQSAFNGTTGHSHDGTTGNSPKIELTAAASVNGILPLANGGTGQATTTAFAQTLLDDANASAARTTLGVAIGTNVQAYDAGLQSISGLTTAADTMIYTTALDVYATTALTPFARTVLDDTTAGAALTTLGVSAFAQTLLDDAAASNARTTLGLGTSATVNTGTSGATIPLLNGVNTWSGDQTISSASPDLFFVDTDTNATTNLSGNSAAGSFVINVDSTSVGSAPVLSAQVRGVSKLSISQTGATFTVPVAASDGVTLPADENITFADGAGGLMFGTDGNFYYDSVEPEFVFLSGGVSSNASLRAGSAYLSGFLEADQIHLTSTTDVTLASTGHAFQVGLDSGVNLVIDNNEIMARNNGAAGSLVLQNDGGVLQVGGVTMTSVYVPCHKLSFDSGGTDYMEFDDAANTFQFVADSSTASPTVISQNFQMYGSLYGTAFASGSPSFTSATGPGIYISDSTGIASFSRSAGNALQLQRTTSDGSIAAFFRQTTSVGSISVAAASTTYNTSSDVRLKHDFQPINPALLDQINVYDFAWNIDDSRAYGVKAQELYEVVPQAVFRGDDPEVDMWGVDYSKLVPIMIAKIQDLEARLKVLES